MFGMTADSAPFGIRCGDWLAAALAVAGPLTLYVLTLPHTVMLEDDGLFLMAGAHLGIAHPPGYPLYTLICHLFLQLPATSPAWAGHLSSAVLGAAACGFAFGCARLLGATAVPAIAAAWLLGASEHFWAQAIIAEVYTLHALLFFATYAFLLRAERHPAARWPLAAAAVAYGLSLANHWPLMALATPGLMLAAWPLWRTVRARLPALAGLALLSAGLPYAWMVWRSLQHPVVSFYGPIDSLKDFWFYLSRQGYASVDVSASADWSDRLEYMGWLGAELVWQATLPGFMLAAFGLVLLLRRRTVAAWSGPVVLLGQSVVLIMLLDFDFNPFRIAVFRPYSLVCYGLVAIWMALGLQGATRLLLRRLPSGGRRAAWLRPCIMGMAGLGMAGGSVQAGWTANDLAANDFAKQHAELVFDLLPENAVLLTYGEISSPIGYFHLVERRRPDITLYNTQSLIFSERLFHYSLSKRQRLEAIRQFVDASERPVFHLLDSEMVGHFAGEHHGYVMRAIPRQPHGTLSLVWHDAAAAFFRHLLERQPLSRWEHERQNELVSTFGSYLGLIHFLQVPQFLDQAQALMPLAEENFHALLSLSSIVLDNGNEQHWDQVRVWLQKAEQLRAQAITRGSTAQLQYLKGRWWDATGHPDRAQQWYRLAYRTWPDPANSALERLKK